MSGWIIQIDRHLTCVTSNFQAHTAEYKRKRILRDLGRFVNYKRCVSERVRLPVTSLLSESEVFQYSRKLSSNVVLRTFYRE